MISNIAVKNIAENWQLKNLKLDSAIFIKSAIEGDLKTLKEQLELGIDINTIDENGWTVLHHAIKNHRSDVVHYLLSKKASTEQTTFLTDEEFPGYTELHLAAHYERKTTITSLINSGAQKDPLDANKMTPLAVAAKAGQISACKHLLRLGANVRW